MLVRAQMVIRGDRMPRKLKGYRPCKISKTRRHKTYGYSTQKSGPAACSLLGLLAPKSAVFAECRVTPGTVITKQNWMQYGDCFSAGVQHFWQGDLFWKMPDEVQIHLGPLPSWTLPQPFVEATEKYGAQTRLVKPPDGCYKLDDYVAGVPFLNPSGPDKGTESATPRANVLCGTGKCRRNGITSENMRHRRACSS